MAILRKYKYAVRVGDGNHWILKIASWSHFHVKKSKKINLVCHNF